MIGPIYPLQVSLVLAFCLLLLSLGTLLSYGQTETNSTGTAEEPSLASTTGMAIDKKLPASSSLPIEQSANPPTIQNIVNENACLPPRTAVDVVFSIDSSWSMEQNDPANL